MAQRRARAGLRRALENASGSLVVREVPHGFSAAYDMKQRKPEMDVVFDVGANVGQTASVLVQAWPTASVYCIEPFAATFRTLERNTADDPRITCVHCGFASRPSEERVVSQAGSVNNSLVGTAGGVGGGADDADGETVTLTTFDDFCRERGIEHVDLLKIDTEGLDLDVLRGAEEALSAQRVTFVQVEAGMTRHNTKHVPFRELHDHLEGLGYVLFGIYDQRPEWDGEARLRFANPVFIAESEMDLPSSDVAISSLRAVLGDR